MINKKERLFIFLDTNIHLHFQVFNKIPWEKLFNYPNITLIFSYTTLKELEKKKVERGQKQVGKRATNAIAILSKLIDESSIKIGKKVTAEFCAEPVNQQYFDKHSLNTGITDDHLLAEILLFREKNTTAKIVFITDDLGLKAKAKYLGINVFNLDPKLKLPPEIDEDKKKIQVLEKENAELKLRKPQLKLSFAGGDYKANYFINAPKRFHPASDLYQLNSVKLVTPKLRISEAEIAVNLELLEKLKGKDKSSPKEISEFIISLGELATLIPNSEYERYNAELDLYYDNYSKYLQSLRKTSNIQNLTLSCSIHLINNGTAPAEDIDIFLDLPDEINFIYQEEFPQNPVEPMPPEPPSPLAVIISKPIVSRIGNLLTKRQQATPVLNSATNLANAHPDRFFFSENRQHATFKIRELKHYYSIVLPEFYIIFRSFEKAKSFEISYKILPKNLTHPTEGKLKIIIEKQQPDLFSLSNLIKPFGLHS